MAVTLSDINATLESMREEQERTTEVTRSLVDKISAQVEANEKANLKALNTRSNVSQNKGLFGGALSGFDPVSGILKVPGFLSGLIGKAIKWATIAGAIALFLGPQIVNLFEYFEELTGINLGKLIGENPEISAAIGLAGYYLIKMLLKWALKYIGGVLGGLGAAAIAGILGGADDIVQVDPDEKDDKKKKKPSGKKPGTGKGRGLAVPEAPKSQPKAVPESLPKESLPKETPKKVDVPEKPKATAPKSPTPPAPSSPAAKGIARFLGKGALRFIPYLGWGLLAADAYMLYDWLSEPSNLTPEEAEQKRIEAGRAPGEIPTNENSSVAPNRMKAREIEKKRQESLKKTISIYNGDNIYSNVAPGLIDPIILQGKINAFNEYGVDRDRQRTASPMTTVSNITADLMQRDYKERTAAVNIGGNYVDARSTNVTNSTSQGIIMPMGPAVDVLDGGYADKRFGR